MRKGMMVFTVLALCVLPGGSQPLAQDKSVLISATGNPAEGPLEIFLGEPVIQKQMVFNGGKYVREPYMAVAVDGTVLVLRNKAIGRQPGAGHLRRSEDGGQSWGEIIDVPFGFLDSNFVVDEDTGDILVIRMWDNNDRLWRSSDHGKTWKEEKTTLKPNEVMKWIERTKLKERGTWEDSRTDVAKYFMHANASESGITLRHGEHRGRLIVTAGFRPHSKEHPSSRDPIDAVYCCAIYSDDGGATWQVSGFFPDGYTEEAAIAELQDGRIYYNSRSGRSLARISRDLLKEEDNWRRTAWSYDGGETWEGLEINMVLPDGGGYDLGYGNKGGLVRLPVRDRDILIYSNTDTGGGARIKMTVWASFDGGKTWPVKRLVNAGPSGYSSLSAGRPGTPGSDQIYLLFESGEEFYAEAMQVARFNLSWILQGELTGNGRVPDWIQ